MAREDDQKLKDMMRAIELGEIEEDILEGDQEDYEDMGGINSLKRGAPSIKLASETGAEEFDLELMSVIREFKDKMQKGELDPGTTVDDYINDYLSRKRMMMEDKNRQMAMYGGRMQYGDGAKEYGLYEDVIPKRYPDPVTARLETDKAEAAMQRDIQKTKYPIKKDDKKIDLDIEAIRKLIEKRKKEAEKKAKGGIAGVL
jgi:hypothetical protein